MILQPKMRMTSSTCTGVIACITDTFNGPVHLSHHNQNLITRAPSPTLPFPLIKLKSRFVCGFSERNDIECSSEVNEKDKALKHWEDSFVRN